MEKPAHKKQQQIWDAEHKNPDALPQMNLEKPSSGVTKFLEFLRENTEGPLKGLEMACGKGRNVIWLSGQEGIEMHGFDFSPTAVEEAKKRARTSEAEKAHFIAQDATEPWQFESESFDFVVDCFGSTDIESSEGRAVAVKEMYRVLKPGGYLMVYLLSTDDEFHKEMMKKSPAEEPNAFYHPTGKFEKTFTEEEIWELYRDFSVTQWERVEKTATFKGKDYYCKHFWIIFRKD